MSSIPLPFCCFDSYFYAFFSCFCFCLSSFCCCCSFNVFYIFLTIPRVCFISMRGLSSSVFSLSEFYKSLAILSQFIADIYK